MIGVLSDTHSLLRPQALEALRSSTHILHAGDIGNFDFLEALRAIAPVTAIRGNIDTHGPAAQLPATEAVELNGKLIYMLHSLADLDLKPEAAGISVVVYGHSHKPGVETTTAFSTSIPEAAARAVSRSPSPSRTSTSTPRPAPKSSTCRSKNDLRVAGKSRDPLCGLPVSFQDYESKILKRKLLALRLKPNAINILDKKGEGGGPRFPPTHPISERRLPTADPLLASSAASGSAAVPPPAAPAQVQRALRFSSTPASRSKEYSPFADSGSATPAL